jgi:hypothetical protein
MEWVYRCIPNEKRKFEVGFWIGNVWHADPRPTFGIYNSPEWAANRAAKLNQRQEPFTVVVEQPEY